MAYLLLIGLIIFLILLGLFLRKVVHVIGLSCQFCEHRRTTPFAELAPTDRENLLTYFQDHEKRDPDITGIFACESCKTVYDDFSGEKKSMDADGMRLRTFCKVCNSLMFGSVQVDAITTCKHCHTEYQWQVHEPSGFRILMPPPEATILKKCNDHTLGLM